MTKQEIWYIRMWTSSMPIVCQLLSSYRCCLSMFIKMSTDLHRCPLGFPHCFVLRYRLNRFKEALEILGSRHGRQHLLNKFPRILEKTIQNTMSRVWSVFISDISVSSELSVEFPFDKQRPPGRAKIQRKSLAERDWKLRLGSCSSKGCCFKEMLKQSVKDLWYWYSLWWFVAMMLVLFVEVLQVRVSFEFDVTLSMLGACFADSIQTIKLRLLSVA